MRDLSGYATLRAVHEIQHEETRRAHSRLALGKAGGGLERAFVLGRGVNHAFGSQFGRYRFVEAIAVDGVEEGAPTQPPPEFLRFAGGAPSDGWEWFNLVGLDTDYGISGIEYRPEYRLGDEYTDGRNSINAFVDEFESEESLLYRYLTSRTLRGLGDYIVESFANSASSISDHFKGPADGIAFVNEIPTANVKLELEYRALKNRSYIFKQHDLGDVTDLALSLPYCDAVWPDAHWSHIARSS